MASPFPKSSSRPGHGRIVAKLLPDGATGLETTEYQYPLKLIAPKPAPHHRSASVFLLSYGGGLVGGDQVNLTIDVCSNAKLSLVTQGHTKVFKSASPDIVTRQNLTISVQDGASICLLPDPVQPFRDSVYEQVQAFTVAETGSVCLLDWVTQGRSARGENWSFVKWHGRNEIWQASKSEGDKGRLLVRDAVKLNGRDQLLTDRPLKDVMHQQAVFGTLILRGDLVSSLAGFFLSEFAALPRLGARGFKSTNAKGSENTPESELESWRAGRLAMEKEEGILWCAASVRGCVIVKFGAATVEGGRRWIGSMIIKEGSIAANFGDEALFCVR